MLFATPCLLSAAVGPGLLTIYLLLDTEACVDYIK